MYRIYKYVSHGGNAGQVKDFRYRKRESVRGKKRKDFKFGGLLWTEGLTADQSR